MTRKQGFLRIPAVFAAFVFLCVLLVPTMAMASPSIIYGGTISGDYPFTAGKYFIDQGATVTFNGNVTIPADCTLDIDYGTVIINGNLLVNGTLDVDGGTLTVQNKNSTVVHGTLNLSVDVARQDLNYGGTLHATGAMTVEGANAQLIMINSNDLLTVDGKLTMDGADTVTNNSTEYNLSDGMLVLNGDFEQKATYASRSFYPERNPTGMQTYLCGTNKVVKFAVPDYSFFVNVDLTSATFAAGSSLSIRENLSANLSTTVDNLFFGGDLQGYALSLYGNLHVPTNTTLTVGKGQIYVHGNMTVGREPAVAGQYEAIGGQYAHLDMTQPTDLSKLFDYVWVQGNFTIDSSPQTGLTNGLLWVCGNFTQAKSTYGDNSFAPSGNFATVLEGYPASGTITFASGGSGAGKSKFNILYLPNNNGFTAPAGVYYNVIHIRNGHLKSLIVNGTPTALTTDNVTVRVPYNVTKATLTPVVAVTGDTYILHQNGTNNQSSGILVVSNLPVGKTELIASVTSLRHVFNTTITIERLPKECMLAGLKSSAGTLSPVFSAATNAYTLPVAAGTGTVTLTATKTAAASVVKINGAIVGANTLIAAKAITIQPGVKQTVTIDVTKAGTSTTNRYTVTLNPGTAVTSFTAAPLLGGKPVLSPGGTNTMTFTYKIAGPSAVTLQIYKSGAWVTLATRTVTAAGTYTTAWNGKVGSATLAAGTYSTRVISVANGVTASKTLSVQVVGKPTIAWGAVTTPFVANGTSKLLCSYGINYPGNVTVQIVNSAGKVMAVLSYTNVSSSASAANKVYWNGKATAGNTAGLTVGKIAPAGAYTVKIIAGAASSSKSITIKH